MTVTVASAISRARSSFSTSAASSRLRGARYQPPTRTLIGCTSRPPTTRHELVAGLLQLERLRDELRVVTRQLDRVLVAEEVGRVEHEDVQRVALDPLAAVEEPAQRAELAVDLDAADLLHRLHGAHLVGDRADPADAGGDVGRLGEVPAAQERLEEARRLVDLELHVRHDAVVDLHEHRALALDAGQVVGPDRRRALLSHRCGPPRTS